MATIAQNAIVGVEMIMVVYIPSPTNARQFIVIPIKFVDEPYGSKYFKAFLFLITLLISNKVPIR